MFSPRARFFRFLIASALAALILTLSPGFECYQALAVSVQGKGSSGVPISVNPAVHSSDVPKVQLGQGLLLSPQPANAVAGSNEPYRTNTEAAKAPGNAQLGTASGALLPFSGFANFSAPAGLKGIGPAVLSAAPSGQGAGNQQPSSAPSEKDAGTQDVLRFRVGQLGQANSDEERRDIIDSAYTGSSQNPGDVPVAAMPSASAASESWGPAPLSREEPRKTAPDAQKPAEEGIAAVAKTGGGQGGGVKSPPSQGEPQGKGDAGFSPEIKKAIFGLFLTRFFSLIPFSLALLAYTPMVIETVGKAGMYNLGALGSLISIVMALAVGKIGDKLPLKKYILFNFSLRAVLSLTNAVLYAMGWMGFWPLLLLTAANAWQFASLFVTDDALMAELVGANQHKLRSTLALIKIATIVVTVLSGIFLGKHIVDALGYGWTFFIAGVLQVIPVFILWKTIPNIGRKAKPGEKAPRAEEIQSQDAPGRSLWFRLGFLAGGMWLKLKSVPPRSWAKAAIGALLIAGALGLFFFPIPAIPLLWSSPVTFFLRSPIPFIFATAFLLWRSRIYQTVIKKHPMLKLSLVFIMVCAFAEIPLRNSVLGVLATETVGKKGTSELFGNFLAAFYMGQMPSGTGMIDPKMEFEFSRIGPWKLKRSVHVHLKSWMKWIGAFGLAAWMYFILIPQGWLASLVSEFSLGALLPAGAFGALGGLIVIGGSVVLYLALHNMVPKVSERGWMRLEILGLLVVGFLPLIFGLSPWAIFLGLAVFGFTHNPTSGTISANNTSQGKKHAPEQFQFLSGIRGAFFNMATAIAMATYGLAKTIPERLWGDHHAFPFTWYVIAGIYGLFAVLFAVGSFILPFEEKKDKTPQAAAK